MSVFVWKQKNLQGNFSTSPFPKGEARKIHHQPWTLFAATVAGQDKANAGHYLDTTPPTHPTQDASSSPPGLNYITTFLGDREFPYKPLCATLTGRGVDPIYFSIYLFFPGMQLTFPFEILWLPTGKKRSFGFRNENHHTDVGSKLKKKTKWITRKNDPPNLWSLIP